MRGPFVGIIEVCASGKFTVDKLGGPAIGFLTGTGPLAIDGRAGPREDAGVNIEGACAEAL